MTDNDPLGPQVLLLFPPFLRLELIDDDAFRKKVGLNLDGMITLDGGAAKFARSAFFDAIRSLHAGTNEPSAAIDEDGVSWTLTLGTADDVDAIALTAGERRYLITGFSALSPDRDTRLERFDQALKTKGLPPESLPEWRGILADRSLENEEVRQLDRALNTTPIALAGKLDAELSQASGSIELLVPTQRLYYERLIGAAPADDVAEYADTVVPSLVAGQLQWNTNEGAKLALLLASHPAIMPRTGLALLPADSFELLAEWAIASGDPLAKVGVIELGLQLLPQRLSLENVLLQLVEQIRDLDAEDPGGTLALMSATFVAVDGELSRLKILEDWPPFRRRIAAFAQASLLQRRMNGRVDVAYFSKWAHDQYAHRFYLQTLIDLRSEPRWLPDLATAGQLKAELIGRIHNAAGPFAETMAEGALRQLLFGDSDHDMPQHLTFPSSLLPGPIEGAETGASLPIPPELETILDKNLSAEALRPESAIAMINTRGVFSIDRDKVDRVVKLIRAAGYRFPLGLETEDRNAIFAGLAAVASTTRSPDLAGDVRVMMRKVRADNAAPLRSVRELRIALTAAASYEAPVDWAKFFGEWAMELVFAADRGAEAQALKTELEEICVIEPFLRRSVGPALAAISAHLAA